MPTISPHRDIRQCFTNARRLSAGAHGVRWVVIVAADGKLINVPVPSAEDADRSLLRDVRLALAPNQEPVTGLHITAICCTTGAQRLARSFHKMLELVPNLSYLVGAVCLGNTVVAFEGRPGDFVSGCTDADVLLIDDGMLPMLQPDWAVVALKALRQPRIILFGRDGKLSKLDRVVEVENPEKRVTKNESGETDADFPHH
jgi:hypothetical protein